jgi:hypothetical protein
MKKQYWIAPAVGLLLVLMSAIAVFAINGTAVDWWVVAGGGAPSSADSITMNGTLGQPVVGLSSDGDVSLEAGYWVAGEEYSVYFPMMMR